MAPIVVALAVLAGCGDGGDASSGSVEVVATTTQLADLGTNVAGDRAAVSGILAPNSDPHEYEPRPSDGAAVAEADLILRSGGEVDLWLDQIVESSGNDAPVLTALDSMPTIEGDHTAQDSGEEVDPHWWQDPRNAVAAVEAIRDSLIDVDPEGAAAYRANARDYIADLRRLDAAIARCIDRVAAADRKLVTSHDALGYFADRYGIEAIGAAIPALSTQAQASAGETADLVDLIRAEGVKAIFPEAGVSTQLEDAIARETGAQIGGELWADALGPPGTSGATYLEAMAANAEGLVEGFSGERLGCPIELGPD